jgi:hypothetical protein
LPRIHRSLASCLALVLPCDTPSGGMLKLNLAVCPSAACSPHCSAKVPLVIGKWLPVLRQAMRSCASPSLRMPSTRGLPVLRRSAHRQRHSQAAQHLANSLETQKGALMSIPSQSIQHHGIALAANAEQGWLPCAHRASAPSLTSWSRGRPVFASLRQGQARAPYLGR